jgi:hypothetical protein
MLKRETLASAAVMTLAFCGATGCISVGGEDKPITINLNVKIDQEVRVKLDKPVEDLIAKNPDAF